MAAPLLTVRGVTKDYRSLRPLRLQHLDLRPAQAIALLGFDLAASEVLVNLLTGAMLPDTGEITILGRVTATIGNADDWVSSLDTFGLISERAIFLEELTAEQNLALPLSLAIKALSDEVREQVRRLAGDVGLSEPELATPVAALSPLGRQRVRLGRALALDPRVLLAEHPNAPLSGDDTRALADDLARVIEARQCAALILTADRDFATRITGEVLMVQPATGLLKPATGWRRFLP